MFCTCFFICEPLQRLFLVDSRGNDFGSIETEMAYDPILNTIMMKGTGGGIDRDQRMSPLGMEILRPGVGFRCVGRKGNCGSLDRTSNKFSSKLLFLVRPAKDDWSRVPMFGDSICI